MYPVTGTQKHVSLVTCTAKASSCSNVLGSALNVILISSDDVTFPPQFGRTRESRLGLVTTARVVSSLTSARANFMFCVTNKINMIL